MSSAKVKVDSVVVDGDTYVRADSLPPLSGDVRIVILQRGWVMVGRYSQDGEMCALDNAQVIRRFGTTKGLGQIAIGGPTSTTELDPAGHVDFHILTVIATLNCNAEKWSLV